MTAEAFSSFCHYETERFVDLTAEAALVVMLRQVSGCEPNVKNVQKFFEWHFLHRIDVELVVWIEELKHFNPQRHR